MTEREDQADDLAQSGTISVGELLRQNRESKQRSLREVADALCLTEDKITALEADDYSLFAARIYVRGYLHNYARYLQIDSAEVLAAFERQVPRGTQLNNAPQPGAITSGGFGSSSKTLNSPRQTSKKSRLWLVVLLVATALIIIFLTSIFLPSSVSTSDDSPGFLNGAAINQTLQPGPPRPATSVVNNDMSAEIPLGNTNITAAAENSFPGETGISIDASFSFTDDCLTDIRDTEGKKLVYDLKTAGSHLTLTLTQPVKVFLNNAAAVQLQLNGIPYPFPRRGPVARFELDPIKISALLSSSSKPGHNENGDPPAGNQTSPLVDSAP